MADPTTGGKMLQAQTRDETYHVSVDPKNALRVVLARTTTSDVDAYDQRLWCHEAADAPSMKALVQWVMAHHDRWQEWGQLAEQLGPGEFHVHMLRRMELEPVTGA